MTVNQRYPFLVSIMRFMYRSINKVIFPKSLSLKQIKRGDITYLIWLNEEIGRKLFLLRKYEMSELAVCKKFLSAGDVCIDVGGNIGFYALNFANICGPNSKVYVFEPISRNFNVIRLAADLNKFRNIEVFQNVVSDKHMSVNFDVPEDSAYAHISVDNKANGGDLIESITLDEFVKQKKVGRVKIMKIDVEGSELLVLKGARSILADENVKPEIIMMELFSEYLQRYDSSICELLNYMEQFGYKPFYIDVYEKLHPYNEEDHDKVFNVFFLQSNRDFLN